jgi:DNA-binding response OmpR family regulator
MITQEKIKILAVGCQTMLSRLAARIDDKQISVRTCSSGGEVPGILRQERFDIIIIDDLFNDIAAVCQDSGDPGRAPVAVMCRKYDTDWKKYKTLEIDGFFPDEAGASELMARIMAFSRRYVFSQQASLS